MRRTYFLVAFAFSLGLTSAALADEVAAPGGSGLISELKIGALAHDVPGLWSGFQAEKSAVDLNAEVDFHPFWASESSSIAPAIGGTFNTAGQTSHAYADLRWKITPGPAYYITLGLGAAFNNGVTYDPAQPDRKWLGSHILFHPTAEIGLNLDPHNSVSVYFEHMSNANLADYNEGMDDIGVRYGYRF
jgi:lipid A 3-O-deacylase